MLAGPYIQASCVKCHGNFETLKGEEVAGSAHIKTGTLADVRAIGGYVLDRKGHRHAVVMMINHPNAHMAQPAMDELLRWVYGG